MLNYSSILCCLIATLVFSAFIVKGDEIDDILGRRISKLMIRGTSIAFYDGVSIELT